jgi:putative phosphoesterase
VVKIKNRILANDYYLLPSLFTMKKIILISDTHGFIPETFWKYLDGADELWHAGDVGTIDIIDKLKEKIEVKGVYGNIDGEEIRKEFKEYKAMIVQGVKILMLHIGGKPYVYSPRMRELMAHYKPEVVVCGHSHILRVEYDKRSKVLFMNPGALGRQGFHHVKTFLRFNIHEGKVSDMEVIELEARAQKFEE